MKKDIIEVMRNQNKNIETNNSKVTDEKIIGALRKYLLFPHLMDNNAFQNPSLENIKKGLNQFDESGGFLGKTWTEEQLADSKANANNMDKWRSEKRDETREQTRLRFEEQENLREQQNMGRTPLISPQDIEDNFSSWMYEKGLLHTDEQVDEMYPNRKPSLFGAFKEGGLYRGEPMGKNSKLREDLKGLKKEGSTSEDRSDNSYEQTQLGLGLAGMTPVYGIGSDFAALLHSIKNEKAGDSLLNLGAMVPGLGLFAGAKKVDDLMYLMKNTGMSEKEALEVINKYQKSGGNTPVMPDKRLVDASPQDIQTLKNKYRKDARDQIQSAEKVLEEDLDLIKTLRKEKGFNSKDIIDIIKKPRE